jgi:hypothetical protein
MSRERTLGPQLPRAAGLLVVCVGLGGAIGCTAYPTLKVAAPLDCSVEDQYEFQSPMIDTFEPGENLTWFSSGDPNFMPTVAVEPITDGTRCGSTGALVYRTAHNNDWGSLIGDYGFPGPTGRDGSMYEGLSFWARAPGNTNKTFTILLGDANTNCGGTADPMTGLCPDPPGAYCKTYSTPDGGSGAPLGTVYDPATGMPISGTTMQAPPADSCGNAYFLVATVTADWRLYTFPFGMFQQGNMPNHVPNSVFTMIGSVPGTALLTTKLTNFTLRMPKEATVELWMDNLSFYRKKGSATGSDGGTDAR